MTAVSESARMVEAALFAAEEPMSVAEIAEHVGADSLGYLSLDGLYRAINVPGNGLCTGCLTGRYPVDIHGAQGKLGLEAGLRRA